MKKEPRYPRITPLRAMLLLRELDAAGSAPTRWLIDKTRDALANHVMASRGKAAHVLRSDSTGDWWWTTEWAFGRVESLEEAMAKADERLVTAGYLVA